MIECEVKSRICKQSLAAARPLTAEIIPSYKTEDGRVFSGHGRDSLQSQHKKLDLIQDTILYEEEINEIETN